MFILLSVMSVTVGMAQDVKLRHDTLCIYSSWQTLMDDAPHTLLVNPVLTYAEQSNRLNISSAGGQSKKFVESNIKQSMAVVLIVDSISSCYVNCAWLNKNMKEGVGQLGYEGFLRYEGSKHKKDEDMINDFLEKYMSRIATDVMVPYIDEVLTENE